MISLPITRKQLLKEYLKQIDIIADAIDWKTTFSGQEVCSIIYDIMIKAGLQTNLTGPKLHKFYNKQVNSLNLTDAEWRENYDIPNIVNIVYDILEEKA